MSTTKPRIGITLGDCAGIGPEIVETALKSVRVPKSAEYKPIGKYPDCTLGRRGELDAIVTGPIHKARMNDVGFKFPGETEFFAERCGAKNFAMCLTGGKITVALVTTHIPLSEVPRALKQSEIVRIGLLLADFLSRLSSAKADRVGAAAAAGLTALSSQLRIAVAGLNPHAGESGK